MKQTIIFKLNMNFEQERHLHNLCSIGTKLYNTANWLRRQSWEETGEIPNYNSQDKELKNNVWYKLLPSQTAQGILENLDKNYKSWFKLRKKDNKANPPMFRKKEMLSVISFKQCFKIIEGKLRFGMSRKYKEENKIKFLEMPIMEWKNFEGIAKFCQIKFNKGNWYAHVVYEIEEKIPILNNKVMSVDVGIINTAVTCDTQGNTNIYSGKQILAIQHYFNKEKAKLTSILTKQYSERHSSRALRILQQKQNRQLNQALHTHSKKIVTDCINKEIKTLVVGDITDIRKDKNFGKKGNQKLHSWSFSKFTEQLRYKCAKVGIRFVTVNEAYTSQMCSCCKTINKKNRKHRGLYKCKTCGVQLNADVNGSVNILNKYLQDFMSSSIGNVAIPSVTRITNVCPC